MLSMMYSIYFSVTSVSSHSFLLPGIEVPIIAVIHQHQAAMQNSSTDTLHLITETSKAEQVTGLDYNYG